MNCFLTEAFSLGMDAIFQTWKPARSTIVEATNVLQTSEKMGLTTKPGVPEIVIFLEHVVRKFLYHHFLLPTVFASAIERRVAKVDTT